MELVLRINACSRRKLDVTSLTLLSFDAKKRNRITILLQSARTKRRAGGKSSARRLYFLACTITTRAVHTRPVLRYARAGFQGTCTGWWGHDTTCKLGMTRYRCSLNFFEENWATAADTSTWETNINSLSKTRKFWGWNIFITKQLHFITVI